MDFAICTENLGRTYKIRGGKKSEPRSLVALTDVNLEIHPGELFGLLGPNGAGKTTLIKILTTLLAPTTGHAWVAGYDVTTEPDKVRPCINMVSGGETSGYGLLTVRENLWMFSQFYGLQSDVANRNIKHLLEVVGLTDRTNTKSSDLSTGLRQKMNIVRGFMTDPDVIFLDEPTLGLDVSGRKKIWEHIRVLKADGMTIFMTTHYLEEAEKYCNRVAIIDKGKIVVVGSPENLINSISKEASLNDVFLENIKTPEEQAGFNSTQFRNLLRRR